MTKDNYELLGFIISRASNGLMVYSSADGSTGQVETGQIGDAVVKLKNKREYRIIANKEWLAMPKSTKEATKTAIKKDPALNELQEQINDLKGEKDESANSLV